MQYRLHQTGDGGGQLVRLQIGADMAGGLSAFDLLGQAPPGAGKLLMNVFLGLFRERHDKAVGKEQPHLRVVAQQAGAADYELFDPAPGVFLFGYGAFQTLDQFIRHPL